MPRKIDLITELYKRTIKDITSDSVAWRAFLHSAAYQYKYPFADQVLIFAQRPKAIACAGMELWNTHFGRWIKRGATGIALIDKQGSSNRLHYVFDVSDTRSKEEWPDERPFELWWVKPEYHADVIEALQNRFMDDDKPRSKLSDAVMDATITLCTDNMTDYLQELSVEKEGSFLEELDDDSLRVRFFVTLQAGVAYTVLTRLGFHADDFVSTDGFEWVHEFNTPATVNILGTATSDISEICLREIERTVRGVERSIRETNRTFDGQSEIEYTDSERETNPNRNGGIDHGNHLQDRERDPNPESGDARADELSDREVRSDEIEFHEGTPQGNLHDHTDRGTVESVFARDRRDGKDTDRDEYIPDGTEPWGKRADESRGSNEVGADDEQHQGISGGGSSGEPDLSVGSTNGSIMEDLPQIEDPESLIQILRHGDYLRHSKQDIVSLLSSDKSDTEKAEYVRSAYPPFLFAEFYKPGTEDHLGYRAAEDGLLLYEGKFMTRKAEVLVEWPLVTQLIGALIKDRNYLDEPRGGEQLSLLDVDTESGQTKEEIVPDTSSQMRIPQEVIDEFLRLGGCIRNSAQRIYGFYRRANNQAENVAFLKSEYEKDSVGIVVGNRNYAVKWDENGVRISTGDRVSDVSSILLPWEYIDKRIRELLEAGQYLTQNEAEKADEIWETYVADKVAILYREDYENIPKEYKTTSSFLWPEINNFYREILRDTESLPSFIEEMQANEERVKEYPGRFRRFHDGKKIAGLVSTFLRDPVDFPQADPHILPPKQFVTQDKIDAYLTERGTPYSDGKLAIYSFFLRNKDTKERASFLAKSYGIGGSGGSRIDTNHDGKGLALYGGLQHWKDGILLKWPQVAKRVDELIKQGKYLNDREKQELDRYERKIVSERIRVFYSRKGKDFLLPYADHGITGYWEDVADLQEQIQSKERLAEIVEGMQTVFESLIPGGDDYARENYERDKQALEDVKSYLAGKFNIFPNSPYRLKTPFAPEKAEPTQVPAMHENEPVEENLPDTEYDLKLGMTVYIGKDEMEILSLAGDKVELFDGTLIPLELDFATFMKRLRENGLNDGLKKPKEQAHTDAEIARILPEKGDDILLLCEDRFSYDRFYVDEEKGEVTWFYFNPDSTSRGQFVENIVTFEQISMLRENEDYTVFFDKLGSEAKQYIVDSDDEEFRDAAIRFLTEEYSFRGYSSASREILVSMADEREKADMKGSPKRFSIRKVPYEAGRVGIWDASIKKYLGENGQLYLFAEQADAEEYLKRIQRENGIPEAVIVTTKDDRTEGEIETDRTEEAELTAVSRFLHATRMDDIDVYFDMGEIVARDGDNEWRGKAFYEFLLNDVTTLDENMHPVEGMSINDEILKPVIELAERHGANIVRVGDENTNKERAESNVNTVDRIIYEQHQKCKEMYPRRLAMLQHGNNYYFFDKDAEKVQSILKSKPTETVMVNGEQISAFVVPLLEYTRSVFKLKEEAGMFLVHADKDTIIPVDNFIKGHRIGAEIDVYPLEYELARLKSYDVEDGITIDEDGYFTSSQAHYVESERALAKAKKCIEDFCAEEYQGEGVDFSDLSNIGIGYTTITDSEIPIQVVANLRDYKIEKYLDGKLVEAREYESLQELTETGLENLVFEDLVYVSEEAIEEYKQEQRKELPQLAEEPKPRKTFPVYNSHPERPDSEKHNYRITDNEIGTGGAKAKFRKNIEAIQLLYALESENRLATPEEQEVLAQYSGWGGLADAFDSTKDNWHSEYNELKNLLTPEEYEAANESTLTAFYTPPVVIKAMYNALENMGFKRGNILEPSCGVGNFMGLLPQSMDAKMYGVELDSISGRIARQLYQKNGITIDGYEKTHFPDSFFDVAIGNVPFNDFKLLDKKYDKYNFLIHDYFFAKTLDKVRPGGVIAFITSSGTLDKENPSVRKYISQRADFLGAIRLPNNTFDGAGAKMVVSDIIFLQKRDRIVERDEDWVHRGVDENGIRMNQYFIDNPDMVLGEMVMRSGQFGPEPTCRAYEDEDLGELIAEAVSNIHAEISEVEIEELSEDGEDKSIPADPTVKNFSFTIVDGNVYYRQNSVMNPVETSVTGENRIKGMIGIRDTVKALIEAQLEDYPESEIKELQSKLNRQYDEFTAKYGLINSRGNAMVFSDDNSYFLLCSLEILDENKELKAKADMFTKRTIKPQVTVDRVDTASEALALSMGERAMVDMEYMSELTGKNEEELFADLKGVIFRNPEHGDVIGAKPYLMADEYLAGNVREKLKQAREKAEADPEFAVNVEALEQVQPEDLSAAEIGVRLGTTWIPESDVQAFVYELLGTSFYARRHIQVKYIPQTAQWVISNKTRDIGNVKADNAYGTHRINAYEIIEQTLNLKDVRIFDYVYDANGNKQAILNKKETAIAQGKQEQIKRAFDEWIWKDPARRERLCKLYNERFNSIRPREFDGSHIKFYGMNPEITLRKHQSDAVARIMYGGNSLLAHVVGAGKTFTMVAAAQESKRLGLCSKSMFVVPNHLIEQWASEYLQLYPSANILVATKKDFETKNRKKFCARIATGDYDAVIIGHSQFEKIPMSLERQIETLNKERDEILQSMGEIRESRGDRITTKQLAKAKKQIETKLKKLNDQSRKDDVVTFEELGVDRLFVDEAHFYKNLAAYTKMRNVAGISQTEAQKSSDLYMKCRYLDELTGGKGCVFATGTPISNTMVELYTMQKYLQYGELQLRGLLNFDSWASTFGETVTAIELAPDGSGYRAKTRFAKFFNIPELMAMFKQTADIQTADMLNLPVPEAHYHIVKVEASDVQKKLVESFAERAEKVHNRLVDSSQDNMLLITNDGRKAALDQRLINTGLGDYDGSKVNTCVENIYEIWEHTADKKSAQLVFCDLSTPKGDGSFNVYDDIRQKLIAKGIPADEIEFIHNADSDAKKKELFAKVRRGQIRVLMGSTFKMGAGTNVQQRLIALHDLDVPWRPADLEQRAGRIVRQGNTNSEVDLYRYVTEGTFDAYSYQLLESKQKFISQVMTSKSPVRSAEDVDETALSYAEIKALASGNPKIMEKMQLDADVAKLKLMKADYLSQRYGLEDAIIKHFPRAIAEKEEKIRGVTADIETALNRTVPNENGFSPMVIMGKTYTDKADAGKEILAICERITNPEARPLGEYRGFQTDIGFDTGRKEFFITLRGTLYHKVPLGTDAHGIITRLDNAIEKFDMNRQTYMAELGELHRQVENAKAEIAKPFPDEAVLEEKSKQLAELNAELDMDRHENEILDGPEEQGEDERDEHNRRRDERSNR
jgi:N12 class adenine-specific DNA methylase/adenine-specific DNA methylase